MDLILYDGVCGLCNGLVRFVLVRERRRFFRFAALQSAFAQTILTRFGKTATTLDTFYLVEDYGGAHERVLSKSRAALAVGQRLGWWWILPLYLVPPFIADRVYDFVAKRRYRWFGRHETCPVPAPEHRALFLDIPSM